MSNKRYIRAIATKRFINGKWQEWGMGYRAYKLDRVVQNDLTVSAYKQALAEATGIPMGDISAVWTGPVIESNSE